MQHFSAQYEAYSAVSSVTLYIAAVDADPTTSEMPITEWLWNPSAYVIITMPAMAKMAATI